VGFVVFLFGLFLTFWYVGANQYINMRIAPEGAMEVYVTGKQWMWKFAYTQGQNAVSTLYVPARRPVKLIFTSRDVIHSFYVPEFRIKQDVVPSRYTTAWFEATEPGTYPILCTEYCGTDHSRMRGEVIALEPRDFERWLGGEPTQRPELARGEQGAPPEDTLVRRGEIAAAQSGCLRCHTTDGLPHIGPTWAGMYGSMAPLERGGEALVDEAYITESMMDPEAKIHRGFARVMPSFLGRISPAETAAIIEFIKSLRDVHPQPGARGPLGIPPLYPEREKALEPAGGAVPPEPPGSIPLAPPGGFVPRETERRAP